MRQINTLAALALLALARSPMPAACTSNCFEATMTGASPAHLEGRAAFRVAPDGSLLVVLSSAGSAAARATIVIERPVGAPSAHPGVLTIHESPCEDDDPPEEPDDDAPPPPRSDVAVTLRGGPPLTPTWLAGGQSGTVSISSATAAAVSGRFELRLCGNDADDKDIVVTLKGTFNAARMKP
ncbi:MAG: hypothetical protein JWO05_2512 [Gemmatimonadetes bacterium]|nr:hypothetical protein [Gemmatimonadota bacterium]